MTSSFSVTARELLQSRTAGDAAADCRLSNFELLDAVPDQKGETAKADLKPPDSRRDSGMGGERRVRFQLSNKTGIQTVNTRFFTTF
jgi:hypothetical protein